MTKKRKALTKKKRASKKAPSFTWHDVESAIHRAVSEAKPDHRPAHQSMFVNEFRDIFLRIARSKISEILPKAVDEAINQIRKTGGASLQ